jgi:Protein of unknown function (DUF3500)
MAGRRVYREWGSRHPSSMGLRSGRFTSLSPRLTPIFAAIGRSFEEPYVGITTDGTRKEGLFPLAPTGATALTIVDGAREFLRVLSGDARLRAIYSVRSSEWRRWTNAFPPWEPHGVMLEDLDSPTRELCLDIVRACSSNRGFDETQQTMLANEALALLTGDIDNDSLGAWKYYFALFGLPSVSQPWGWQLWGHHLHISCLICRGQMVMTPFFLGAEPAVIEDGPFAGLTLLQRERAAGLALMRSLSALQQESALLGRSMFTDYLPDYLRHPTEGRMRTGHGRDNLVLSYEGLQCRSLSAGALELLRQLVLCYVGRLGDGHAGQRMTEVERYFDETYFAWVGGMEDSDPFYYKVHSPVILIEYDNHAGVFLDNPQPEPFHVHTMMRTPNGNDYGFDYLRQHYSDHHGGGHLRP